MVEVSILVMEVQEVIDGVGRDNAVENGTEAGTDNMLVGDSLNVSREDSLVAGNMGRLVVRLGEVVSQRRQHMSTNRWHHSRLKCRINNQTQCFSTKQLIRG